MSFQGGVTQVEVLAISFRVQLAKEFGCKEIIVVSDSINAVQVAVSSEECYLTYGAIVEELRECIKLFDSCSFKYVRRTVNETAHRIAHMTSPLPTWEEVWVDTLPSAICTDMAS